MFPEYAPCNYFESHTDYPPRDNRLMLYVVSLVVAVKQVVPAVIVGFVLLAMTTGSLAVVAYLIPQARLAEIERIDQLEASSAALRAERERVKSYESQLQLRLAELSAVLNESVNMSFSPEVQPATEDARGVDGVGGSDESFSALEDIAVTRNDVTVDLTESQDSLARLFSAGLTTLRTVPVGYPVLGRMSSHFGPRISPFTRRRQLHKGIDIAVDRRSKVQATGDGTIIYSGWKGGFGRTVVIDHGNGIKTLYAHLNSISVKVGDNVCRGERIGYVGSSGRSTGPHLHYEVRVDGRASDPEKFIRLAETLKHFTTRQS